MNKCVRTKVYKSNLKIREFTKKASIEKIKSPKWSKRIRVPKFRQTVRLSKSHTSISFNYFMKPSIYKWLRDTSTL